MSKLVERIASFVKRFISVRAHVIFSHYDGLHSMQDATPRAIDSDVAHWRVGPHYITTDNLKIVGLIHVSAGTWQLSTLGLLTE